MMQNCKSHQCRPGLIQDLSLTEMDSGENLCSFVVFFLKKHLSNICRGPVWSFLTNLPHNEVKVKECCSERMSEVFDCAVGL